MNTPSSLPAFGYTEAAENQALSLPSIRNSRELGGYVTKDHTTIRRGALLRTAALTNVTEEDKAYLTDTLHLSSIIDLRASFETQAHPEPVFAGVHQHNLCVMDETLLTERTSTLRSVFRDRNMDAAQRTMLVFESRIVSDQMYVEFLSTEQGRKGYQEFFRILLNTPQGHSVLWHCSYGKDRTGVAAMLLMGVLNVDEQTIMRDFLLTNEFFAPEIQALRQKLSQHVTDDDQLSELLVVGNGVYAPYMQNALDYIKANYGDIPSYAKAELGLTDEDILTLRRLYTH